jgi:hypothetical protein
MISTTQVAEIGKIMVEVQPWQKISETLISTNKPGIVGHIYNH